MEVIPREGVEIEANARVGAEDGVLVIPREGVEILERALVISHEFF